jgi:hypothetical protein
VQVRDLANPPNSPRRSVGRGGMSARIAGRYVTWLDGEYDPNLNEAGAYDVVVYDRVDDREVYRIPGAAMRGRVAALDHDSKGNLVVALSRAQAGHRTTLTLAWASLTKPSLHRLPLPASEFYDVRINDGVIAFERRGATSGPVESAVVGLTDLTGHQRIFTRGCA